MKKIIPTLCSSIIVCCIIAGCEHQKSIQNTIALPEIRPSSWVMLTTHEDQRVIFQPCDANNPEVKLSNDTLYINWGLEEGIYKITSMSTNEDIMMFTGRNELGDHEERFYAQYLDDERKLWRWYVWLNDSVYAVFADSRYVNQYKTMQQPCSECWGSDVCDDMKEEKDSVVTMARAQLFKDLLGADF